MKKIISVILAVIMLCSVVAMFAGCGNAENQIIVHTNAFFAPFEYYDGTEIKGVDVEVMKAVGELLNKEIVFENVEFSAIIDNVSEGKVCDAVAAGITITDARKEKVDFSIPYYTSVQYVIWAEGNDAIVTVNDEYVLWDALAGMKIGVQTDTTGAIYTDGEINATADDPDYGYDGVLYNTNTTMVNFDNAQLAADAITQAKSVDVVIIDELPAQFITDKNDGLVCLPLYYAGGEGEEDSPTEEQYAICVTKGNTELLEAINAVLEEYLVADENGENQIQKLVMKHMGLE
jgi:polar amino acid transport system substrate-binding protein